MDTLVWRKGEKAMDILLSIWFGEKVKKQWIYFYLFGLEKR